MAPSRDDKQQAEPRPQTVVQVQLGLLRYFKRQIKSSLLAAVNASAQGIRANLKPGLLEIQGPDASVQLAASAARAELHKHKLFTRLVEAPQQAVDLFDTKANSLRSLGQSEGCYVRWEKIAEDPLNVLFVVSSLVEKNAIDCAAKLEAMFDKYLPITFKLQLDRPSLAYVRRKRRDELSSIQENRGVQIVPTKLAREGKMRAPSGPAESSLSITGGRKAIDAANRDLQEVLNNLDVWHFVLPFHEQITVDETVVGPLKMFCKNLPADMDFVVFVDVVDRKAVFDVCGPRSAVDQLESLKAELTDRCGDACSRSLSADECKTLYQHLVTKKNISQFVRKWSLLVCHLDRSTQTIQLACSSRTALSAAMDALSDVISQTSTQVIEVPCSAMTGIYVDSRKSEWKALCTERVRITKRWDHSKPAGQQDWFIVQGPSSDCELVAKRLEEYLKKAASQVVVTKVSVPVGSVPELRSERREFERDTHTTLQFPTADAAGSGRLLASALLPSGQTLQAVLGDIIMEKVEAIVNPANSQLLHKGGIALAISTAAGPDFQKESLDIAHAARPPLQEGDAVSSSAGDLSAPIRSVIHAVGPVYSVNAHHECIQLLFRAVTNSLIVAQKSCRSISLPAISSGIFNFPLVPCAATIVHAVRVFFKDSPRSQLQLVRLIANDEQTGQALATAVRDACANTNSALVLRQPALEAASTWRSEMYAPPSVINAQWSWRENDGTFVPYDADQNEAIERHYQRYRQGNAPEVTNVITGDRQRVKNGQRYRVLLGRADSQHQQENIDTKTKRAVRRIELKSAAEKVPEPVASKAPPISLEPLRSASLSRESQSYVEVCGDSKRVQLAVQKLKEKIATMMGTGSMDVPVAADQKEIQLIAHRYQLLCEFKVAAPTGQGSQLTISFQGFRPNFASFKADVLQYVLLLTVSNAPSTNFPAEWEPQPDDRNCALFSLQERSEEFKSVTARFGSTMPNAKIVTIQRVQNKHIWNVYSAHKQNLQKKLGRPNVELQLFHGTRATKPSLVYNGEHGFDHRFGTGGMWGNGIYFAVNSLYSHSYCYKEEKICQMFLASVLVGDPHQCAPDSNLRKPPPKPSRGGGFEVDFFDSVTGETGGSKVYIQYEAYRAYPSYIISYRI